MLHTRLFARTRSIADLAATPAFVTPKRESMTIVPGLPERLPVHKIVWHHSAPELSAEEGGAGTHSCRI